MTTKAKLVSTIAAFCLVLALMVVGVLAASSVTVNLGGSLSFTASDVDATVKVVATGCAEAATVNGTGDYTKTFNADSEENSWTKDDIDLTFSDKDAPIVITITVTNNSDERALKVSFTGDALPNVTASSNVTMAVTYGDNAAASTSATLGTEEIEVGVGEYAEIKLTISIDDANKTVSSNWDANLTLENVAA